jgi:hypothetical protein
LSTFLPQCRSPRAKAPEHTALHNLTEAVEIRWKDRLTIQQAVVMPDANDVLLGALPLEGMDLYVDPVNQRLAGVHGDKPVYLAK